MKLDEDALKAAIKELRELVLDDELQRNRFTISEASIKTYLTAMAERGFQMMPREASETMQLAGSQAAEPMTVRMGGPGFLECSRAARIYRAMFDANAKAKP